MSNTNQKIETLNKLRTVEAIYVLMSSCTRMPYVVCDPETFDDEILLYYTEAEAKEEAMKLQKEGNPMQLVKVDENSRLSFYRVVSNGSQLYSGGQRVGRTDYCAA